MASNLVQVKEAIVITPSEPTPTRTLTLSTIDSQLFLRFTNYYLLVYNSPPPPDGLDRGLFSARIKEALGRALVDYYPLSGRVQQSPDGPARPLQVVCQGQGVMFVEAESSEFTRLDFERAPHFVEEWRPLVSIHVDDVLKGDPPLVVQLTWLADGSVALGFGFSHCICDGTGSGEFLNLFAELTRRVDEVHAPQPVWDRHLLDPSKNPDDPNRLQSLLSYPEFNRVEDRCGFLAKFSSERLVPTSNTFTKLHINHLKKEASQLNESKSYTSFDVISAHIWISWAKALNMPPTQTLKLLFTVNIRNRIKPGLPDGYYGNGLVLGCAQTTVKDLTENDLGYASDLIKRAKERVDSEYVKEVTELVSGNRTSPDLVGVLVLSQWTRLGLEKVDFGLGSPTYVGSNTCGRYCLLLPVHNQRAAVRVMVAVPTSTVDLFQQLITKPLY